MPNSDHIKDVCEYLYKVRKKSVKDIAVRTGVPKATLYRWIQDENWDAGVLSRELSRIELANALRWHIHEIQNQARTEGRPMTASEIDAVSKLLSIVEKLNPEILFVANAIEALERFSDFVRHRDPELHSRLIDLMMRFVRDLADQYIQS